MHVVLQTAGVLLLSLLGLAAGYAFSRRKRFWILGFALPLPFILLMALGGHVPAVFFWPPVTFLMWGRREHLIFAVAVPMALAAIVNRLPHRRQQIVVTIGVSLCTVFLSVPPFLIPALSADHFSRIATLMDFNGVCIQSNGYTCGPAAAVTALRQLGLPAEEGDLARLSYTTPLKGTQPDSLCDALRRRWGPEGLACEYRPFASLEELRTAGLTIAVIKLSLLLDHYVAVLEVTDDAVLVGDPLVGKHTVPHERFLRDWRRVGIVVTRTKSP